MLIERYHSILEGMPIGSIKTPTSTYNGQDSCITGIEEDLILIRDRLCGEQSVNLEVIPIVGMGGIGKTTLATHAYQHPSTFDHFDIQVWVTVSRNSSLHRILLGIMYSIFGSDSIRDEDSELLLQRTYTYLKGRRYLVVLDDIWDTNLWDDVTRAFPDDSNGSRIMVTTRELCVASYVNSRGCPHEMRLMCEDRSWRLLKEKVFGQESCPLELENVGKVIAQNCRGLPLAIVLISGVLSKLNRTQNTWEKIASNVIEALHNDEQFSDILSVSYNNLPCHLRPCFLYMGGFPEDREIKVSRLVKLWAAEGFLISKDEKMDVEELGYEYLEELAKRSLVLIGKKRYDGKIKTVKIHDVLRDICIRKAGDEKFLGIINEFSGSFPQGIENSHRLSILSYVLSCIPNRNNATIRTLLLFNHWALYYWKDLRLLRVLEANAMSVTLSSSDAIRHVGELCHLTHLAFTCESSVGVARQVVESLYQLHNLQTLIARIKPCYTYVLEAASTSEGFLTEAGLHTTTLNLEIWRMPQLRHLILLDGFLTDPSPETCPENVVLENLHTLSRMRDLTCSERLLEMIPNIKKMGICYSHENMYESGWSNYGLNNLVQLSKLEKLSLYADPYPDLQNDVCHNLAFPLSLQALTLSGCRIPWKDMALVGSLPNLQMLKLKRHACVGMEWETMEGGFCELKQLLIDSTDLHYWILESSSYFPRLERLILYECYNLIEIPHEVGEIATLELMEVDLRNPFVVHSAASIQEEQQSCGNDLKVRLLKSRTWKRC